MDFLFLKLWVDETSKQIINSRFKNVFWDGEKYILEFNNSYLNISLFSGEPLCFFSDKEINQKIETTFTNLISKHLYKSIIEKISIAKNDKIISIYFQKKDIDGEKIRYKLIIELINRYENMIFTRQDENEKWIILDSHKRIGFSESRFRQILPGLEYQPPPQVKKSYILELEKKEFYNLIGDRLPEEWEKFIQLFSNVPKFLKDEFISEMPAEDFWKIISQIKNKVKALEPDSPESDKLDNIFNNTCSGEQDSKMDDKHIIFYNSEEKYLSLIETENSQGFSTINDAFQFYYQEKCRKIIFTQLKNTILHNLQKQVNGIEKVIAKESVELHEMKKVEKWKKFGELLKVNFSKIKRGQKEIEVTDYFEENAPQIVIPLNEELSPKKNMEYYFKRYKKAKSGTVKLQAQIEVNKKKLQNILDKIAYVERCENFEELCQLQEEKRARKKKAFEKRLFRRFSVEAEGRKWEIFVGRSNRENDELTTKFAKLDDWFFHSRIYHGAHLIVRNPERLRDIPPKVKNFAAGIAAYFSKAKHSTKVPVDFTKIRYVSKPRKSPPGFVVYRKQKTLFVDPIDPRKY
ncbi:MAG: NFACT family protein [Candidatus Cloacimonadota bacterium]|nr:NFACT family protein [Candidatus Cloacimonadota bacterium]